MTDTTKTGGPAFPHPEPRDPSFSTVAPGMTLRDWFAGQALAGEITDYRGTDAALFADAIAARCYAIADAMIAARGDA